MRIGQRMRRRPRMGAPQSYNLCDLCFEGGMNWKGPFHGRQNDTRANLLLSPFRIRTRKACPQAVVAHVDQALQQNPLAESELCRVNSCLASSKSRQGRQAEFRS
jgi:hypothetical protein